MPKQPYNRNTVWRKEKGIESATIANSKKGFVNGSKLHDVIHFFFLLKRLFAGTSCVHIVTYQKWTSRPKIGEVFLGLPSPLTLCLQLGLYEACSSGV